MTKEKLNFTSTEHYEKRVVARVLRQDVEAFILKWGVITRATGASHLTVVRRKLPIELRRSKIADQAEGWIIVVSHENVLVTCYRHPNAWRFVRRKSELKHPVPIAA